jgi:hypothetical protein
MSGTTLLTLASLCLLNASLMAVYGQNDRVPLAGGALIGAAYVLGSWQ